MRRRTVETTITLTPQEAYIRSVPAFQTLPRFERDWKNLTRQQQAMFGKVVIGAFVPDLMAPDRPFRPGLRVRGVAVHPGVFEMTWDNDGRATLFHDSVRAWPRLIRDVHQVR